MPHDENIPLAPPPRVQPKERITATKQEYTSSSTAEAPAPQGPPPVQKVSPIKVDPKINRNDPCPCGSGKKYKQCHGK